jgi:threonine dehydrogenase-like Zn-dependent dehydrogenase
MRGLVFDPSPSRLLIGGLLSRITPAAALSWAGPLALREVPDPDPPGDQWATLEPLFTGVCGSDVLQATLQADRDNPLSGLISFPHIMGHEVVARVTQPRETSFRSGEIVVVNPWLGCEARGLMTPCPACQSGLFPQCDRMGEPPVAGTGSGVHVGNIRGLPGGFSTAMVAHRSQLHRWPAGLDPALGVLADPLAVALHAADQVPRDSSSTAVVIGAGTIGLCVIASLRQSGVRSVLAVAAWPHQLPLARDLGAEPWLWRARPMIERVAGLTGGRVVKPWFGDRWLAGGGADVVIDAVGTTTTTRFALGVVRARGTIVRVGVGRAGRLESSLLYFKEARLVGSNGYRSADLDQALAMLADDAPYRRWLTHVFPLERWKDAIATAARPAQSHSVKVTIEIGSQEGHHTLHVDR